MKVLYLAPDPVRSPKGAGVRIARTVRTLQALGHEVELLTPGTPDHVLPDVAHTTVHLDGDNYLDRMLAFRRAAAAWVSDRRGDVVQFRSIWEGLPAIAWAQANGARAVFEAHGFPSIELPYHYPALLARGTLLDKLIREEGAVLSAADLVISHSKTGRRYLLMRSVPPGRIAVVPNAVNPDLFSPAPHTPPGDGLRRIVYIGTLAPWQGLPLLLEALAPLKNRVPFRLTVLGPVKARWRKPIRAFARRLRIHNAVEMAGATDQENVVPVLRQADVCVAPLPADARNTVQGCCPIKVLEYMSTARPILATAIPPLAELLTHEETAILTEPTPTALTGGLQRLLADPDYAARLGAAAREQVQARFAPHHFQARIADAYERVTALGTRLHGTSAPR